jgi:subtilisin
MRWTRALIAFSLLLTMVAAGSAAAPVSERSSYIVVFQPGATANVEATARQLTRAHGGELGLVYQHALRGFSASLSAQAASALARNPMVAYVEADQLASIQAQDIPTGIERIFTNDHPAVSIGSNTMIDVDVAVIDTGIASHPDLNIYRSTNCSGGSPFRTSCGSGGADDNGHGTHVAGTIAAKDNDSGVVGVAPGARLWSVKVLRSDGSGYLSWIIAGVDYVTANAGEIEVANMSLGGAFSSAALNTAIANSVAKGVAYAVAAGNSNSDAAGFSPANHPDVLTVSALADFDGLPGGLGSPTCRADEDDTLANFSNWGPLIDIAAPGVCILSTWLNGGFNTISGTSMASPHAAGGLALLAAASPPANGTQVKALYKSLVDTGNLCWTDDSGDGIKEPLLDLRPTGVSRACDTGGGDDPGDGGDDPGDGGDDPGDGGDDPGDGDGGDAAYTVSLSSSGQNNGSTWTAFVNVGVSGCEPSGDCTVVYRWNADATHSCDADCSLSRTQIPKRTGSVTFTVISVNGSTDLGGQTSTTVSAAMI